MSALMARHPRRRRLLLLLALCGALAAGATAGHASVNDVHGVTWNEVVVPGRTCATRQPIHLDRGHAVVRSALYPTPIGVNAGGVVYGDLDGDGQDEAALSVECDNRGGTADGQLRFTWVVF